MTMYARPYLAASRTSTVFVFNANQTGSPYRHQEDSSARTWDHCAQKTGGGSDVPWNVVHEYRNAPRDLTSQLLSEPPVFLTDQMREEIRLERVLPHIDILKRDGIRPGIGHDPDR